MEIEFVSLPVGVSKLRISLLSEETVFLLRAAWRTLSSGGLRR